MRIATSVFNFLKKKKPDKFNFCNLYMFIHSYPLSKDNSILNYRSPLDSSFLREKVLFNLVYFQLINLFFYKERFYKGTNCAAL